MTRYAAHHGFSLVELLLVLAIIGVVAAMAAPRYAAALDRYHVDAAARRIAADLERARTRARTTSSSQSIVFDVSHDRYAMVDPNGPVGEVVDLSQAPYRASLGSGAGGYGHQITFDGFGMPSQVGGVAVSVGGLTRNILIDPQTGEVTIQ